MRVALERGFCSPPELAGSPLARAADTLVRIYLGHCGENFPRRAREFVEHAKRLFPRGVVTAVDAWHIHLRVQLCERAPSLYKALRQARVAAEKLAGL